MEDYEKGKADRTHLRNIFGKRVDGAEPTSRTAGLNNGLVMTALLNNERVILTRGPATKAFDANNDGEIGDEEGIGEEVVTALGDKREAAAYWYNSDIGDTGRPLVDGFDDSKVDLQYDGAPSFNAADYTGPNSTIKSPFGPNLNIPTIDGELDKGAFTSTSDNTILIVPQNFDPNHEQGTRFGTHKAASKNVNSNGSLMGPGHFSDKIKQRALTLGLPSPDRATIDYDD